MINWIPAAVDDGIAQGAGASATFTPIQYTVTIQEVGPAGSFTGTEDGELSLALTPTGWRVIGFDAMGVGGPGSTGPLSNQSLSLNDPAYG